MPFREEYRNNRTWNSKTFTTGGQTQREFHIKWLHYLDDNGQWQDIDPNFVQIGEKFTVEKAPFKIEVPLRSIGTAVFTSNNRYDIFEKARINDAPFSQTIKALGVVDVPGEIETGNLGFGEVSYIVYKNAYPTLNADLIYWVHHGKAPRLKKIVRFNSKPSEDVRLEFEIGYSDDPEIKSTKETLTDAEKIKIKAHLSHARFLESKNEKGLFSAIMREELAALDVSRETWKKNGKLITKKGISHRPSWAIGKRGVGIKDPTIWDGKQQKAIEIEYEKIGSIYKLTKILRFSDFESFVLPFYTDTVSTFYPDPDVEVTSVDGN